jgi:hypothetical protein
MLPVAIPMGLGWGFPGRPIRQVVVIESHTYSYRSVIIYLMARLDPEYSVPHV